jgi:hypothetical protein
MEKSCCSCGLFTGHLDGLFFDRNMKGMIFDLIVKYL